MGFPAEFLGGGILVQEVQEDTLAESLGLKAGDVVLRIGEHRIVDRFDVAKALGAIDAGEKVVVKANRKGEMVSLQATKKDDAEEEKADESRGRLQKK